MTSTPLLVDFEDLNSLAPADGAEWRIKDIWERFRTRQHDEQGPGRPLTLVTLRPRRRPVLAVISTSLFLHDFLLHTANTPIQIQNLIAFGIVGIEILTFFVLIVPLPFTWRRALFKTIAESRAFRLWQLLCSTLMVRPEQTSSPRFACVSQLDACSSA